MTITAPLDADEKPLTFNRTNPLWIELNKDRACAAPSAETFEQ